MSTRLLESNDEFGELTFQQRRFVKFMLISKDMSPTDAARQAAYADPVKAANRLMKNKTILKLLGTEIKERDRRTDLKADDVLEFLHTVLYLDTTEIFDTDGLTSMEQIKALPLNVRRCIQGIETDQKWVIYYEKDENGKQTPVRELRQYIKIKWMSKDEALALALKHHGLLQPDIQINVLTDRMKAQVLLELLGGINDQEDDGVIDAVAIQKIAEGEDP